MSQRLRVLTLGLAAAISPAKVGAAELRGTVVLGAGTHGEGMLGYTRTRVSLPSSLPATTRRDAAVFLKVEESLPLPTPSAKWPLQLSGLRFEPAVVSCAVDETVEITNRLRGPATVVIGNDTLSSIAPGASLTYLCQQSGAHGMRVQEWPHIRGTLFVGEVGVAAAANPDGRFTLSAPQGTYQLQVLGVNGVVSTVPVTLGKSDLDLGTVGDGAPAEAPRPAPVAAPPPPPPPPRPELKPPKPPAGETKSKPPPKPKDPAPDEGDEDPFQLEP